MKSFFRAIPAAAAIAMIAASGSAFADAATVSGNVNVSTTLAAACEVSAAAAAINFGTVTALASSGDQAGNSGSGFKVACTTGLSPKIYSVTDRVMDDGAEHTLPFDLCLTACTGSNGLATTQEGADNLSITQDGDLKTVTLYARIQAANFKSLPAGSYSKVVNVSVDY